MELTRRQLLAGVGATTLAAAGSTSWPSAPAAPPAGPWSRRGRPSSTCLGGLRVVTDNDVEVVVPPLHHEIVTFRLPGGGPADLRDAQRRLAQALAGLDQDYASSPGRSGRDRGVGAAVLQGRGGVAGA